MKGTFAFQVENRLFAATTVHAPRVLKVAFFDLTRRHGPGAQRTNERRGPEVEIRRAQHA